jgi:hypothetical protein
MVPLRIPSPDCVGRGFLFCCLLPRSSAPAKHVSRIAPAGPHRVYTCMHAQGEPSSRSSHLSVGLPLSLMPPTGAVSTIPSEHRGRGAGMQRTWVVGVGVVCLSMATISGGLVSPGAQGTVWSMVEAAEPVRLDPVVVTGTQVALPVSELPSAITVIDREEIESRQVTDVLQLLRTIGGHRSGFQSTRFPTSDIAQTHQNRPGSLLCSRAERMGAQEPASAGEDRESI